MRTYCGGCQCGQVRFEVRLDLAVGTGKCNCSICTKSRLWTAKAAIDDLRLLRGASMLRDYRGGNPVAHHPFCRRCGVRPFQRIETPNMTGWPYYNVNIACLEDVDVDELSAAIVTYSDGLNDDWGSVPAETRHL